jgi:hypothetical protein
MNTTDNIDTNTVLTEQAWALQNKVNPFPVAGTLVWDGHTLSYTLGKLAGEAVLGWVEQRMSQQGLADRLRAGEELVVFSLAKGSFTANWPAMYAGSAVEITDADGQRWLIALDYPSGGAISQSISLFTGRKKGKVWKKALAA